MCCITCNIYFEYMDDFLLISWMLTVSLLFASIVEEALNCMSGQT